VRRAHAVTDEAIVIGLQDYREADRIVTLFCRDHGKIAALARGARSSRKRFGGALELFARLQITFAPQEGLSLLKEAEIATIYPGIRGTFAAIAHASYAAELVTAFLPEQLVNQRLFRLLTAYLEHLDRGAAVPADRHFFEINLLNILGYRPPLESCPGCGALLAERGGRWTATEVLCSSCAAGSGGMPLAAATVCRLLQSLKTGRFDLVRFTEQERLEAERFLDSFIAGNLQRPLKSLAFLRLYP
jgi:DNA repair protein RecO (recombination protein O)